MYFYCSALEAVASLGGEGLTPFYGLLDGGKEGQMFAELENYFYYAQLRSQGINITEEREVSKVVPLDQVPFIMRALGFYPSEQEVSLPVLFCWPIIFHAPFSIRIFRCEIYTFTKSSLSNTCLRDTRSVLVVGSTLTFAIM